MGIFHSGNWTGGDVADAATKPKERSPSAPAKLSPRVDANLMCEQALAEYRTIAKEIGIPAQDLLVEEFRIFLAEKDIPTFNHQEVVAYMDAIAAKDNPTGFGWHWCPVRPKDAEIALTFGRPSEDRSRYTNGTNVPASDFYQSHRFQEWRRDLGMLIGSGNVVFSGNNHSPTVHVQSDVSVMQEAHDEMFHRPPTPRDWRVEPSPAYTRTLPLHALKKIATVEREFKAGQVLFLVTDYTTAPHIIVNPDPFLMAIIPNSAVAHGKGRFIIDVWDEPGFGIERMLK